MSKGDNRLKILYVLDELKENSRLKDETNEDRFLSAADLITILSEKYQLNADRKSIYSYIDSLIKYGHDIEKNRRGYYLREHYNPDEANDRFELPELEMIVDALSASRFISAKKTKKIIRKLENLTDDEGQHLQNRRIYLEKAIKSDNSSVIYNIDAIYQAIHNNHQIRFHYQMIGVDFDAEQSKLVPVNKKDANGKDKLYCQSPYALVWKNEYYYVLCYDAETGGAKTFRVDKMKDTRICDGTKREGSRFFSEINIVEYANTAFSMFGGTTVNITLRVHKELAGIIADRFGKNISIYHDEDENYFLCSVNVQKSDQFYSWLSGFGERVRITFPKDIVEDYTLYLERLVNSYRQN